MYNSFSLFISPTFTLNESVKKYLLLSRVLYWTHLFLCKWYIYVHILFYFTNVFICKLILTPTKYNGTPTTIAMISHFASWTRLRHYLCRKQLTFLHGGLLIIEDHFSRLSCCPKFGNDQHKCKKYEYNKT